jgi:heat shock protein beta
MERIMKAQTITNSAMGMMGVRKILEINTDHPMIREIKVRMEASRDIAGIVDILYETACIDSGFGVTHPSVYANKIYKIMMAGLLGQVEDDNDNTPENEQEEETNEDADIEKLSMEELD